MPNKLDYRRPEFSLGMSAWREMDDCYVAEIRVTDLLPSGKVLCGSITVDFTTWRMNEPPEDRAEYLAVALEMCILSLLDTARTELHRARDAV